MSEIQNLPADIFGGTFDPVQQGHIYLIKKALCPERVLVVAPTTQNPWKKRNATPIALRMEMLRLALKAEGLAFNEFSPTLGQVYLCDFPYTLSVELLRWWRSLYGDDVRWLVGPGDKDSSTKWFRWKEEGCEVREYDSPYPFHASDIRKGTTPAHPALTEFIAMNQLYEDDADPQHQTESRS